MRIEDLERFLEKKHVLGFRKETDDINYLGWVFLQKEDIDNRYLSLLELGEEDWLVRKQKEIQQKPYLITICEAKKAVHEDESNEKEEYRLNDSYRFVNLNEVQNFLNKYEKSLEDIKWLVEIDAP